MSTQPVVIPYDVSMQYINGHMQKIYHDFTDWGNEIIIVYDGSGLYRYNNISFPVNKGDIFVLRGDYVKEILNAERLLICSIYYKEENMQRLASTFRRLKGYQILFVQNPLAGAYSPQDRLQADNDLLEELAPLTDRMIREQKLMEPGFEQVLNSTFFILITLISRAFSAKEEFDHADTTGFAQAVAYMQGHYNDSPKVPELARIAHVSERQFNRRFKTLYGISPSQYLTQLKLGRACALLEESVLSISDIAMDCGFCDINYFSKCFKSIYGIPPTTYRSNHQNAIKTSELKRHCPKKAKTIPTK